MMNLWKRVSSREKKTAALMLAGMAAFIVLMAADIDAPLGTGILGGEDSGNSIYAWSYLKYGYTRANFAPFEVGVTELTLPPRLEYKTTYPPTTAILLSLFFRVFGFHAWVGRLVPVIFLFQMMVATYRGNIACASIRFTVASRRWFNLANRCWW